MAALPALTISHVSLKNADFLASITLDHGPISLYGRALLVAVSDMTARGVSLSLGTFEDLLAANQANHENWRPVFQPFDHRNGGITHDNAFCVLGRDEDGNVVASIGARLYDWRASSFAESLGTLKLLYDEPEPARLRGEKCVVTAQLPHRIVGMAILVGASWYHPSLRGQGLSRVFSLIGKILAFSRWNADYAVGLMFPDVYAAGFPVRFGYKDVDFPVILHYPGMGPVQLYALALPCADMPSYAASFLADRAAQVDVRIGQRTG